MRHLFIIIFFLLSASGCDHGVEWSEGQYEVHWTDTYSNRVLARKIDDGASIGRVKAEVIAIGSNNKYLIAKQRHQKNSTITYSIIDKSKDSQYLNAADITEDPIKESAYLTLKEKRKLPEFNVFFGQKISQK